MDLKKKLKEYIRIQVRELLYLIMLSLWLGIMIAFTVAKYVNNDVEDFLAFYSAIVMLILILIGRFIPESIKKEHE